MRILPSSSRSVRERFVDIQGIGDEILGDSERSHFFNFARGWINQVYPATIYNFLYRFQSILSAFINGNHSAPPQRESDLARFWLPGNKRSLSEFLK